MAMASKEEIARMSQALLVALVQHDRGGVCSLLQSGADPSLAVLAPSEAVRRVIGGVKMPAVVMATQSDDPWYLDTLLKHGARPDAQSEGEGSEDHYPFSHALLWEHDSYVQLLLKAGLNPRSRDRRGYGLLEVAVASGGFGVAMDLLRAGARPEDGDQEGQHLFKLLAIDMNLRPEAIRDRRVFVAELRAKGYNFKLPWEAKPGR
jgi:hypothetical protein